ncbi:MAG: hypothetical protein ABSE82_04060 [Nitrososphaerales archaeon]
MKVENGHDSSCATKHILPAAVLVSQQFILCSFQGHQKPRGTSSARVEHYESIFLVGQDSFWKPAVFKHYLALIVLSATLLRIDSFNSSYPESAKNGTYSIRTKPTLLD